MKGIMKRILNNNILSTSCVWDEGNSIRIILTDVGVNLHFPRLSSNCQNVFPSMEL